MKFIGREYEKRVLKEEYDKNSASLIAIYGRRRVGKTRLIEEYYKDKNIWKFEGLENQSKERQISSFLETLADITKNNLYRTAQCKNWIEAFKLLDKAIDETKHKHDMILFLDEIPYMANRRSEMISELTWGWNNLWSKREDFTLVLCGSIASFMVDSVINSSSLYGRINLEICLQPLSIKETYDFFEGKRSQREIMNLYMFCGGIPAYLMQFENNRSVAVNINKLALSKDGYFTKEFDRIFKDVFHEDKVYRKMIMLFSKYKSLKATELLDALKMTEGGGFQRYLDNLEKAGFIKGYIPCGKPEESKLKRYRLEDEYIHFYFKFIKPNFKKIEKNLEENLFSQIMRSRKYQAWQGLAFERLCLKHINQIAKRLKIDQLVSDFGSYFNRETNTKEGVQIDLLFERHDPVITICELKYYSGKIGKWIIDDIENKISKLPQAQKTIEKVLITTEGITKDLDESGYFSQVLLSDCLFE
ncbi:MAG: ATP-binding protein [Pseudomonadota bacterium]